MELKEICARIDHTILKPACTGEDVKKLCQEAIRYQTASVCIPSGYVREADSWRRQEGNSLRICTVVGFPNGYVPSRVKCYETEQAVQDGADEIDMVIRIGWVKERKYDQILQEIRAVRQCCPEQVLKVIIETCLLEQDEKIHLCAIVSDSGADFIKTSTGFSTGGATVEDVALLRRCVRPEVGVKAAGGIRSRQDAVRMLEAGADRLGTSALLEIVQPAGKED